MNRGQGPHALLTHPDQLARLIAEPDLMPTAIEELLRFDSPIQVAFPSAATEPVQIGAVTIGAGEVLLAGLLAETGTQTEHPSPTSSTAAAARVPTWHSDTASTTASARRWHGWRDASR